MDATHPRTLGKQQPVSGFDCTGKQGKCGHTCHFRKAEGPAKMLVGEPPQTRHLGTKCPIGLSAEPPLTGLFLIGASAGEIDKVVNVALCRHQLPHFLLRGAVLCGEGFFALRQLPAFLFQDIHFGEFGSV